MPDLNLTNTVDLMEVLRLLVALIGFLLALWMAGTAQGDRGAAMSKDLVINEKERRGLVHIATDAIWAERLFVIAQLGFAIAAVRAMTLPPNVASSNFGTFFSNMIQLGISGMFTVKSAYSRYVRNDFDSQETPSAEVRAIETVVPEPNDTD